MPAIALSVFDSESHVLRHFDQERRIVRADVLSTRCDTHARHVAGPSNFSVSGVLRYETVNGTAVLDRVDIQFPHVGQYNITVISESGWVIYKVFTVVPGAPLRFYATPL